MSQLAEADLRALADHLAALADRVAPDTVAAAVEAGVRLSADMPGDPDGLEDLGVACRRAVEALTAVADEDLPGAVKRVRDTWSGGAADAAVGRLTREGEGVATDAERVREAGSVLSGLAEGTRTAHERHGELHSGLTELAARAVEADGDAAAELVGEASAALRAVAELYRSVHQLCAEATDRLTTLSSDGGSNALVSETPRGRRSLAEILQRYQVGDTRAEMVDFPPPELVDTLNPILNRLGKDVPSSKWTVEELELFQQLRPDQMYSWYRIQQEAYQVSEAQFPDISDTTHSHVDAYRHTYWNARMTQEFGQDWAEAFATAHEQRPGNDRQSEAMDLHNNELGREIAARHPNASPERLQQLVAEAVSQGDTIVIDQDSRIAYSDQVGHNATVDPAQHDESHVDHDGFIDADFEGVRPKGLFD